MKKIKILLGLLFTAQFSMAQFTTAWPLSTTSNSTSAGYVGIGTKTTAISTVLPAFNLQLHGTSDFIEHSKDGGASVNAGKTTRFGFTNSTTGLAAGDGTVLRQSDLNFIIDNQENRNISLTTGSLAFAISGSLNRYFLGESHSSASNLANFNLRSTDNGMHIRSMGTGKYGVAVTVRGTSDALLVFDADNAMTRNFKVSGTGEVFARKYTTTLAAIPDYVFADEYNLMPLSELKKFITTNKHLPNIPSAKEYETDGVDLGELNRLLLEKVEELTLYILQMEDRLKVVESAK